MNIREQLDVLSNHRVEFVVVGGQAGVMRQAIEFSHDLDVLIRATLENAERARRAVEEITEEMPEVELMLGRDFQQYIHRDSGTELDIHLKLIALPDYETALRHSSSVAFLGVTVQVLELPALYASKRTDRPRDALHRRAIEDRLRRLLLDGFIEGDEVVLSCCLDLEVAAFPAVARRLPHFAASSRQPLLQARLAAHELELEALLRNPALDPTVLSLLSLNHEMRSKLVAHPSRLAALLARIPLVLPPEGYHVRELK